MIGKRVGRATGGESPSQRELRDAALRNYHRVAPHYERQLVVECGYLTPERVAVALRSRGVTSGRYLDLGAGTGLVGRAIRESGSSIRLVAVDIAEAMLDQIDDPAYAEKHCADVLSALPFARGSYDGVVAVGLLEHVVDPLPFFRTVHDLLCPRGLFVCTFPPAESTAVEVYDADADVVAHPVASVIAALTDGGFVVREAGSDRAYRHGDAWVAHVLVVAERAD